MAHRAEMNQFWYPLVCNTTKWSDNNTHARTHAQAQSETASNEPTNLPFSAFNFDFFYLSPSQCLTDKNIFHFARLFFCFSSRCQFIVVVVVVVISLPLFCEFVSQRSALTSKCVYVRACVIHLEHWIYVQMSYTCSHARFFSCIAALPMSFGWFKGSR